MESHFIYRFDGITLDTAKRRLRRGDQELLLEPKAFRLLEFLIENRDRVLGKEEIFQVVWSETIVTDNALARAIAQIRKALEDDPREPRFIETLPAVGYRFIGKLTAEEPPAAAKTTLGKSPRIPVWGRDRLSHACGSRIDGVAVSDKAIRAGCLHACAADHPIGVTKKRRPSPRTGARSLLSGMGREGTTSIFM